MNRTTVVLLPVVLSFLLNPAEARCEEARKRDAVSGKVSVAAANA